MRLRRPGLFFLVGAAAACLVASCSGTDQPVDLSKATLPGIQFDLTPGWSVYAADNPAGGGIVRLRKANAEAIVDLAAHPAGNFAALVEQYSRVDLPSVVTEDVAVEIGGVTARRISFAGQRSDTAESNGGIRYLIPGSRHAYVFEYLDAGSQMETSRKEAQGMIETIRFER